MLRLLYWHLGQALPGIRQNSCACPRPLCRCGPRHTHPASRAAGVAALLAGGAPAGSSGAGAASGQEPWGSLGRRAEAWSPEEVSKQIHWSGGGVHTRFILARTLMSQRHRRSESHCSVVCFKASVLPTLHTERAMSWICHNLVLKKRERLFCWKLPPWPKLAYEPPKKISFRIFVWIFACSNDKLPQTQ